LSTFEDILQNVRVYNVVSVTTQTTQLTSLMGSSLTARCIATLLQVWIVLESKSERQLAERVRRSRE